MGLKLPVATGRDQFFVPFVAWEQYEHALYMLFMVFKITLHSVNDVNSLPMPPRDILLKPPQYGTLREDVRIRQLLILFGRGRRGQGSGRRFYRPAEAIILSGQHGAEMILSVVVMFWKRACIFFFNFVFFFFGNFWLFFHFRKFSLCLNLFTFTFIFQIFLKSKSWKFLEELRIFQTEKSFPFGKCHSESPLLT